MSAGTKAVVVPPQGAPAIVDYDGKSETLRMLVGGLIEHVNPRGLKRPYCMIVNESGLLIGLPFNSFGSYLYGSHVHGAPIVGPVVILKEGITDDGEYDLFGLTEDEAEDILGVAQLFR